MSQFFAETAHHKIDREKYSQNYEHIFGGKEGVKITATDKVSNDLCGNIRRAFIEYNKSKNGAFCDYDDFEAGYMAALPE